MMRAGRSTSAKGTASLAVLLIMLSCAPKATAHHGDTGEYDASVAIFVGGTVSAVDRGFPHATIDVQAGAPPTLSAVPRVLTDHDVLDMDGRNVSNRLQTVAAGRSVRLLLDPILTGELADIPLTVGDRVAAIAYPRCGQGNEYDGELRLQALQLPSGQTLLRAADSITGYVDQCSAGQAAVIDAIPFTDQGPAPPPSERGSPSQRAPAARADDATPDGLHLAWAVIGIGLGVTVAVVAAAMKVRRSPRD